MVLERATYARDQEGEIFNGVLLEGIAEVHVAYEAAARQLLRRFDGHWGENRPALRRQAANRLRIFFTPELTDLENITDRAATVIHTAHKTDNSDVRLYVHQYSEPDTLARAICDYSQEFEDHRSFPSLDHPKAPRLPETMADQIIHEQNVAPPAGNRFVPFRQQA